MSTSASASIAEEWTDAGTLRYQVAVRAKRWKNTELLQRAEFVARMADVMSDSGLQLAQEASGEVLLRELAALWFLDQRGDQETADFLRESSEAFDGLPRALWAEARKYRKLVRSSASTPA